MGRQGRHVAVDLHTIPVRRSDGVMQGATVLLHDASSETSLEERCQALHVQVSKDPLTQVANRAEFDRMLVNFVAAHQESNLPCSLIMSDIDHFKLINDKFGHQAGDAAIITFAALLEVDVPLGRPGGALRRRRVCHPLCRLQQRLGRPQGRAHPPPAGRTQTHVLGPEVASRPVSASPNFKPATRPKPCSAAPTAPCCKPRTRAATKWSSWEVV